MAVYTERNVLVFQKVGKAPLKDKQVTTLAGSIKTPFKRKESIVQILSVAVVAGGNTVTVLGSHHKEGVAGLGAWEGGSLAELPCCSNVTT